MSIKLKPVFGKIITFLSIVLFASCSSNVKERGQATDSGTVKSTKPPIAQDDSIGLASDDITPSQAEERIRLEGTYDNVEVIDTVFDSGKERIGLRVKYYCLKDSNIVIPKRYYDAENPTDFITHPFVSNVILLNGTDTVLNKQFTAKDFYPFFKDPFVGALKKYGSLLGPGVSHRNDEDSFEVSYSLSIPATDLGIPVGVIIQKNGDYKIKTGY
ncbi:hypothetical protein [Mucilaginibacter psychrotolerans]|uniref:DUF4738 domain-containing protein n=1 Tax=Mucilaginibacter psychrotolerans TaxID=1524096 RepID=A0A4Y8SIQ3_9SPHI|nr:hypothetical protein [Mucilaginibacter psychrotolerans]TFF38772.1 hypothetical protein E2R66_07135 [Mucilaginibacter psychrotolerans]